MPILQEGAPALEPRPRARMSLDVLILNSGEWVLGDEIPAAPWHVLIYRQRRDPRNELHLWLPRQDARRAGDFAFRRYWMDDTVRWCVEVPGEGTGPRPGARFRFTSPDGRVLWAAERGGRGLGDLSDYDLACMLAAAREGPYAAG